mmetsp:Transcript_12455/g.26377  ORF Transcript_12455/g.26377 Transcript_12455/m.26377 type:complete len:81 (-) Transcript_12455:27-269(-)
MIFFRIASTASYTPAGMPAPGGMDENSHSTIARALHQYGSADAASTTLTATVSCTGQKRIVHGRIRFLSKNMCFYKNVFN